MTIYGIYCVDFASYGINCSKMVSYHRSLEGAITRLNSMKEETSGRLLSWRGLDEEEVSPYNKKLVDQYGNEYVVVEIEVVD